MSTTKTTIRVYTAAGANASEIGESMAYEGVSWRNAVDGCDSDGGGRVFLDVDSDHVEFVCEQLDGDDQVSNYDVM